MTLDTAADLVGKFGQALGAPPDGIARKQSLLPAARDEIIEAFKLVLANCANQGVLTKDIVDQLLVGIGALSSFVPDAAAARINATARLFATKAPVTHEAHQEYRAFAEHMIDFPLIEQLSHYVASLASSHART
jgi:hypothetical protein